tara:strand:- start:4180 stop:4536 length:357 start_codon:yes stop_codon:yes gene_type:complete
MKNDQDIDIELGTLIQATHRRQDLIPAFLEAVRRYADAEYTQLILGPFGFIPAWVVDEGDESKWWDSEEAGYKLEELFDILEHQAPEGYYFGANEGDGSDFGYWPIPNDEEEPLPQAI